MNSKASEEGFTIIEFIVASMFMGIVLVAVSGLFNVVTQLNVTANNYTTASAIAQQLLEKYRNTAYSSITTGTFNDTSTALASYPNLLSPRSATVTVTLPGANAIKQVDVNISWTDPTGAKTVELTTQISDIGLNH